MTSLYNVVTVDSEFSPAIVGEGCTVLSYTDRHAYTVIEVSKSGKSAVIQEDNAERTDSYGMTDSGQRYEYTRNPNGTKWTVRLGKRGWKVTATKQKVWMGVRDRYHDFSF